MDRRLALVALWVLFAAAAVGVGFGAAGLVGDPFTDGIADTQGVRPQPSPSASAPSSTDPTPTSSASSGAEATRGTPSPPSPPRTATRTLTTRAGLVSATCRGGIVRLGASPAVGWAIHEVEGEGRAEAKAAFERIGGAGKVEVRATCSGGEPRFRLEDDDSGGGGSDDDGS